MPFGLGPLELLIILVILVVIFGANRLGEIGGALGKTVREFRKEMKTDDDKPAVKAEDAKPEEKTS
jgi:sec-independent protein translocase protein TatA